MKDDGTSRTESGENCSGRTSENLPEGSGLSLATIERLAKQIWEDAPSGDKQAISNAKEIGRLAHSLYEQYKKQSGFAH